MRKKVQSIFYEKDFASLDMPRKNIVEKQSWVFSTHFKAARIRVDVISNLLRKFCGKKRYPKLLNVNLWGGFPNLKSLRIFVLSKFLLSLSLKILSLTHMNLRTNISGILTSFSDVFNIWQAFRLNRQQVTSTTWKFCRMIQVGGEHIRKSWYERKGEQRGRKEGERRRRRSR